MTSVEGSGGGLYPGEGETHRAASLTLERSMHGTGMMDEVAARPGISREEFDGKHVRLEAVARRARRDDVARRVRSALRKRVHVVERGAGVVERCCAVHTATPAIAHGGELDRSLLLGGKDAANAAHDTARRT